MDVRTRNHVTTAGREDGQPMVFAHGFGCDQQMWRFVAPAFADTHRIILFDHVGSGGSDLTAYDREKYDSLTGYADDLIEILDQLELTDVIFVGHSVSAMIGVLAEIRRPELFAHLVLVGPSPRYIDDQDYVGGFTEDDIAELFDTLDSNYQGWSTAMAPIIMGNPDRPELGHELTESFCSSDPTIARQFAKVTFTSDNRDDLRKVGTPCLVLQCDNDVIAPRAVGDYVHETLLNSQFVLLEATGHCPNLSAPAPTTAAIRAYLAGDHSVTPAIPRAARE